MTSMMLASEVMAMCRIGRTTLANRIKPNSRGFDPDFPRPAKLGPRRNGYFSNEIEDYLEKKAARRTNLPR